MDIRIILLRYAHSQLGLSKLFARFKISKLHPLLLKKMYSIQSRVNYLGVLRIKSAKIILFLYFLYIHNYIFYLGLALESVPKKNFQSVIRQT